jgi:hypothetical protein
MSDTTHVHQWGPKTYRDFCHFVQIERTCKECGVVEIRASPRDFDLNPLQVGFADPGCPMCREKLAGNEPDSWKTTTA